jgi:hypothetical protein
MVYDRYAHDQIGIITETSKTLNKLDAVGARAIFKTFNTMGKRSDFINPYSFVTTIKSLSLLFNEINNDFNSSTKMLNKLKEHHSQLLIDNFTNKYNLFQLDPTTFLREMACTLNKPIKKEIKLLQARYEMVRFIETHLDRLIWSPEDGIETWRNVENITKELTKLFEQNILNDINLLDDFYESLIGSYARFITITDTLLPNELYEYLKNELQQNKSMLFSLIEEDGTMETRKEYLLRVILHAYSHKQAQTYGL